MLFFYQNVLNNKIISTNIIKIFLSKMVIEKKYFLFLAPSIDKIFSTLFTLYEMQNSP